METTEICCPKCGNASGAQVALSHRSEEKYQQEQELKKQPEKGGTQIAAYAKTLPTRPCYLILERVKDC